MTIKHKICIVTGTRAEYGLLYTLIKDIQKENEMQLQIIATGMHLSPEFGLTYKEIEKDGFIIDYRVEMLLSSDTPSGITKSIGLGTIGFADALNQLKPDLLVLLGDRYEIFSAAQAALIAKVPIAHIAGGDTTEGAFDEAIRHSITKMSHLHFVTNDESMQRVCQLGENPGYIFNVGSLGIDRIINLQMLSREELQKKIKFKLLKKNLLITFHPVTLDSQGSGQQLKELLDALNNLGSGVGLLFTKPNCDPEGREIIKVLEKFVSEHSNTALFTSLGQQCYLSLMSQVDAVVGNSSSGIYEAPSLKKPTVNIGDRQKGRLKASSVINCPPQKGEIEKAIWQAFEKDCSTVVNPYGDGYTSQRIIKAIRSITDYRTLLKKHFYTFGGNYGQTPNNTLQ